MAITQEENRLHWNYFLALESDLERLSRFVEFAGPNLLTYSIEIAHILLTASSEVDVVLKQLCARLDPEANAGNIVGYHEILMKQRSEIAQMPVEILRFGLKFRPWSNWTDGCSPDWWDANNLVKHRRHEHFADANLKNALNAMGGLFLVLLHFYYRESEYVTLAPAPGLFEGPWDFVKRAHTTTGQTVLYYAGMGSRIP